MYKILTHLHTQSPGVYRFLSAMGEEFASESLEETAAVAKEVLKNVGYDDVKIIDDKEFYVKIINHSIEDITEDEIDLLEKTLSEVGTDNLSLSALGDYEIDIKWGKRPEVEIPTYTVEFITSEPLYVTPNKITDIPEHSDVEVAIGSTESIGAYHLIVNGEAYFPVPEWIEYEIVPEINGGKATLKDITQDYVIEIVPDNI